MAAPKHTAIMIGLGGPDGDGDSGEVSQECIDAADDIAKALGLKVDAETLAMALKKFIEADEKPASDDDDGNSEG